MDTGLGDARGKAIAAFIVAVALVSAVVGWAAIEGAIWLFHHIHIGWS